MQVWFLMGNHQQQFFFLRITDEQKKTLYQAKFQFTNKNITETSVLEIYSLFELVSTISAVPQLHAAVH